MKGKELPGTRVIMRDYPDNATNATAGLFYGAEVVRWNRATNVVEPLYDLFEYANPRDDMFGMAWNYVKGTCSGLTPSKTERVSKRGIEYHHVSSVSVGSTQNLLVASRELSTIWSFAHDGSGVQWVLSSELRSDFAFEHARDAFYQPHDVLQMPNGNLLVVDDGTNRPGCSDKVNSQCWSRFVMYSLSLDGDADGQSSGLGSAAVDVRNNE